MRKVDKWLLKYLEECGYDLVDEQLLRDIIEKFDKLDCVGRQKMRDLIWKI